MHPLHRLLAASLLAVAATASAATDPKASRFYEEALQRHASGDIGGAIVQLKNALAIDRKMLPAQVLLGKALLADSQPVGAEVALMEALRLGVNRAEVVVPMARAVLAQAKAKQLLDDPRFQAGGDLPPAVDAELYVVRGQAWGDLGEWKEALRELEASRRIDPKGVESWYVEVPVRIRARQFAEAATAAERAIALAPGNPQGLYLQGTVVHSLAQLPQALAAYDKALALKDNHVESLVARAGVLIDMNRDADAKRDIDALRRQFPKEPRGAYLAGLLADRAGDKRSSLQAMADITALLDSAPVEFLRFRPQLGIIGGLAHFALGQREKAKPYLEGVIRVQPTAPVAKLLAEIHMADGNVDRAIDTLDGYLKGQPRDSHALSMLASAHMSQGRHVRATQILQDALKAGEAPQLRTALGLSLAQGGRRRDALRELEESWRKDPGQVRAGAAMVTLYLRTNQPKKAVPVAEALIKRQPDNAGYQNLAGMAYAANGDAAKARTAFEQSVKLDPNFTAPQFNVARLDVRAGKLDLAAARLGVILKKDDRNVDAAIEMARLSERRGSVEEASRWYQRAADHSGPNDIGPGLLLVDFHLRGGRVPQAQEAAKVLSGKLPEDIGVILANAQVAIAAKDSTNARGWLNRAVQGKDVEPATLVQVAMLQLSAADPKGAHANLSRALQANPGDAVAAALLAEAELKTGESAKAEARAKDLVAKVPGSGVGHALLGDVAVARNQLPAAAEHYRRAHQIDRSAESLLRLHNVLAVTDPKGANAMAEQWLKSRPDDLRVRRVLADGQARMANLGAARTSYEALLKARPNDAEALNNLANVMVLQKDPGALAVAEKALKLAPEAAHIIGTAGWAAFKAGQGERALTLLRDAKTRAPNNPDTRYFLASVLASLGRGPEARAELAEALKSGRAFANVADAERLMRTLQ